MKHRTVVLITDSHYKQYMHVPIRIIPTIQKKKNKNPKMSKKR